MSYLDEVAQAIRAELHEVPTDATSRRLLRMYAVLLLAKGQSVDAADVHNAWVAWMEETQPEHPSNRPYEDLDQATRAADRPFVEAIRRAAKSLGRS